MEPIKIQMAVFLMVVGLQQVKIMLSPERKEELKHLEMSVVKAVE